MPHYEASFAAPPSYHHAAATSLPPDLSVAGYGAFADRGTSGYGRAGGGGGGGGGATGLASGALLGPADPPVSYYAGPAAAPAAYDPAPGGGYDPRPRDPRRGGGY
jgi:hypothetical protein